MSDYLIDVCESYLGEDGNLLVEIRVDVLRGMLAEHMALKAELEAMERAILRYEYGCEFIARARHNLLPQTDEASSVKASVEYDAARSQLLEIARAAQEEQEDE